MKKIQIFMLLIFITCWNERLTLAEDHHPQDPQIGLVLPLSGEWAFLGEGIRDAALLAQKDLRAKGQTIRLIFEDNKGSLTESVSIGKELVSVKKIDAIISIISGVAQVLKPLATKAGIINIGICSETEVADGQLSFINYLTAEQGVSKFLQYLGPNKSLGIFAQNESGFQKIISEFKKRSDSKVRVLFEEYFDQGTTDFRPILLRRKTSTPDAWLILGISPEIEYLVKQAQALKMSVPITSIESFGLASNKSIFEGAWFVDSAIPNQEFRSRYHEIYGREVTAGAGHAYDSVMLLASAFNRATSSEGKLNREQSTQMFREISDYQGVTGNLTVRDDGIIWSDASIKIIKNGRAEQVSP